MGNREVVQSTSTAPHCFGPWSVPQEAASEQLLAVGAALALLFAAWKAALDLCCAPALPGCWGFPGQSVSGLSKEGVVSIARAEPGHVLPRLQGRGML